MSGRKIIRVPIVVAIIIQALLCFLIVSFFLSEVYKKECTNYGSGTASSLQFSIHSLEKDKTDRTRDFLQRAPGTLIRQTPQSNPGGNDSINIQIGGVVERAPSLIFLGKTIVNSSDLQRLLQSKNKNATIGTNTGSEDTIKTLSTPLFGVDIYFSKLDTSLAHTILGNYILVGLSSEQQAKFISKLSALSGISQKDLMTPQSGYMIDSGLVGIIIGIGLALTMLILGILVISYTLASIKEIGSLTLLGFGKAEVVKQIFSPFFWLSASLIPVMMGVSLFLYSFNLNILRYSLTAGVLNALLVLLILGISSMIVYAIKPLSALKGILPKKILYSFVIFLYLLSSMGLLAVSYALDGPLQQVAQNKKLLSAWSSVGEYETLKNVSPGENQSSIAGLSDQLDHEMYNWYQAIENHVGVYYIASQYYSKDILTNLQGASNQPVPSAPFTLMSVSPNYLRDHAINVPDQSIKKANQGIRIFLIPAHWSDQQVETAKKFLSENVLHELSGSSFENDFYKNKKIEWIKYDTTPKIFTWATQKEEPAFTTEAVLSVVTANNMTPFDAGNLRANVLTGPLKFKNKTVMKKNTKYLSRYHLDDNDLSFIPVTKFVDGLQKKLTQTIFFFGSIIVFIMCIILLILVALSFIFSIVNERLIFVKQTLGFSGRMIYQNVIRFVLAMGLIELALAFFLKSTLGILLLLVLLILQLITIRVFTQMHTIQKIKGH